MLFDRVNFYLNYFKENEKTEDENDPIGLILCAKKDDIFAKYVLGGLSNKVFASKYNRLLKKSFFSQTRPWANKSKILSAGLPEANRIVFEK
ncbi:MAG: hypothetical protein DRP41_01565 [Thermodesulfobacteriota bacterium]|nr:MAG: hypothetical protein DRP41_01565 [Thermodesulfobacteriota bacterium]